MPSPETAPQQQQFNNAQLTSLQIHNPMPLTRIQKLQNFINTNAQLLFIPFLAGLVIASFLLVVKFHVPPLPKPFGPAIPPMEKHEISYICHGKAVTAGLYPIFKCYNDSSDRGKKRTKGTSVGDTVCFTNDIDLKSPSWKMRYAILTPNNTDISEDKIPISAQSNFLDNGQKACVDISQITGENKDPDATIDAGTILSLRIGIQTDANYPVNETKSNIADKSSSTGDKNIDNTSIPKVSILNDTIPYDGHEITVTLDHKVKYCGFPAEMDVEPAFIPDSTDDKKSEKEGISEKSEKMKKFLNGFLEKEYLKSDDKKAIENLLEDMKSDRRQDEGGIVFM